MSEQAAIAKGRCAGCRVYTFTAEVQTEERAGERPRPYNLLCQRCINTAFNKARAETAQAKEERRK